MDPVENIPGEYRQAVARCEVMVIRVAELDMQMILDRPEILCSVAWTVEITLVSIARRQAVRRANSSLSNSSLVFLYSSQTAAERLGSLFQSRVSVPVADESDQARVSVPVRRRQNGRTAPRWRKVPVRPRLGSIPSWTEKTAAE